MTSPYIPTFVEALTASRCRGRNTRYPHLWDGLAGHWTTVQGGGKTLYDVSGYDNHGTLTSMDPATDWGMTSKGYSLDFDGIDGYVVLDHRPNWASGDPFTLSGWYYADSFARAAPNRGVGLIYGQTAGDAAGGLLINLSSAAHNTVDLWIGRATSSLYGRCTGLIDGIWNHVSITYDGSLTIAGASWFVNGVDVGLSWGTDGSGSQLDASGSWWIGRGDTSREEYFQGQNSVTSFWNRALSPNEIQQLYQDSSAVTRPTRRVPMGVSGAAPAGNAMPMAIHHYQMAGGL